MGLIMAATTRNRAIALLLVAVRKQMRVELEVKTGWNRKQIESALDRAIRAALTEWVEATSGESR